MLEKFKKQKLRIAIMVIVGCLILYAVGIATNLFGNRVFSMFWIISNETAHNIATYAAAAGAAALVTIGLTATLIKKRETKKTQTSYKPIISSFKATDKKTIKTKLPDNTLEMIEETKDYRKAQKNYEIRQATIQITEQSPAQKTIQPATDQNVSNNQKNTANDSEHEKLTCPNCKKEFSTPLFMLEYIKSQPKLVRDCPYCYQPID